MTFLQPVLLLGLPLAALPVVIHLIYLYRRRQVKWAAMMFLLAAQRMNKGLSRLREMLILCLRMLAVAAIVFAITRPLAGGWLGLTGGIPDTVLVLLDRSASMEQQNVITGVSKRMAGLRNVAKAIHDAVGTRSHLVLMDSASGQPLSLERADLLLDLPQTEATETTADIPGLLQNALEYIITNKTGRTDIWLLSDFQKGDWDSGGGRWEALRGAFAKQQGVRFHLLGYPESMLDDLGIRVDRVSRHQSGDRAELLLDLRIMRHVEKPQPMEVPLRFVVNGVATSSTVMLKENQLVLQGVSIPIDKSLTRGWGRVELSADTWAGNNVFHFVFDEAPVLRSVIVSDDDTQSVPLQAALNAAADPARKYLATTLSLQRAAEIPWEETALILWQAVIPKREDALSLQLKEYVTSGRSVLFLPPEAPDETEIFGMSWGRWDTSQTAQVVEWWRNDADLLSNTSDGKALPLGTLDVARRCRISGNGITLARVGGRESLLMRSSGEHGAYFLGTLPDSGSSSLSRDGVVLFAMLHRALNNGARTLGKAQQKVADLTALSGELSKWHFADEKNPLLLQSGNVGLRAGVLKDGDKLVALNRPASEDESDALTNAAVGELFAGLDFRVLTDSLEDGRSLTSEVWRTFLITVALALLGETLLCLPPRRVLQKLDAERGGSGFPAKGFHGV